MKLKLVIDVGAYYIKYIEGVVKRKEFFIRNIGYLTNPVDNIKTTENERDQEKFVNILKTSLNKAGIKSRQTISSISGNDTIIHIFELPEIPEDEIESAVKLEIMQVVPEGIKNLDYDYMIIPRKGKKEVVFIGYPKNKTTLFIEMLNKCRLNPIIFDHDSLAIHNFIGTYTDEKNIIFSLNTGHRTTNFLLAEKNGFLLIRDIPYGIFNFISTISNLKNISLNEAEIWFKKEENSDESQKILMENLSDFFTEIKTGIEYFRNKTQKSPEKLFLTGGLALWKNSCELFSKSLGIETQILNPFEKVKTTPVTVDIKKKGPIFTVAFGLMGREIE